MHTHIHIYMCIHKCIHNKQPCFKRFPNNELDDFNPADLIVDGIKRSLSSIHCVLWMMHSLGPLNENSSRSLQECRKLFRRVKRKRTLFTIKQLNRKYGVNARRKEWINAGSSGVFRGLRVKLPEMIVLLLWTLKLKNITRPSAMQLLKSQTSLHLLYGFINAWMHICINARLNEWTTEKWNKLEVWDQAQKINKIIMTHFLDRQTPIGLIPTDSKRMMKSKMKRRMKRRRRHLLTVASSFEQKLRSPTETAGSWSLVLMVCVDHDYWITQWTSASATL